MNKGIAYLIGTGPGDLGLVTLRARQLISEADVIVYDFLCHPDVLRWARSDAEIIYAGKSGRHHTLTQEQINALLLDCVGRGLRVARLKGGDPFVFGRGGEEAQDLVRAGFAFEVVPGVSSAIAAPAYAGIPVTHRDFASSVTFLTGHEDPTKEMTALNWKKLSTLEGTKVILMGVERVREITAELIGNCADPTTPVALIRWGTWGRQQTIEGTLETIASIVEARQFKAPAVMVIGHVVTLRKELNWFESRPLFGQRIVVTRTRNQAGALTEKLTALGADVLEIPTIQVVARNWINREECRGVRDFAAHFDWLIFTSPNAVDLFFTGFLALHDGDIRALGSVKIATVGPATAAKVRSHFLTVALQPKTFTTVELAKTFPAPEVRGKRFCLPRGSRGEAELPQHLQALGGTVAEWTLYDTVGAGEVFSPARERFLAEGAHWITFTSASTVEHWRELNLITPVVMQKIRHLSIGPITSAALIKHRMNVDVEAAEHTVEGMIKALLTAVTTTK